MLGSGHDQPFTLKAGGTAPDTISFGTFVTPESLCPDLLRYEQIGASDGWRGRVVRAFFFVMRAWPVEASRRGVRRAQR
jgi:hypothetical protein